MFYDPPHELCGEVTGMALLTGDSGAAGSEEGLKPLSSPDSHCAEWPNHPWGARNWQVRLQVISCLVLSSGKRLHTGNTLYFDWAILNSHNI